MGDLSTSRLGIVGQVLQGPMPPVDNSVLVYSNKLHLWTYLKWWIGVHLGVKLGSFGASCVCFVHQLRLLNAAHLCHLFRYKNRRMLTAPRLRTCWTVATVRMVNKCIRQTITKNIQMRFCVRWSQISYYLVRTLLLWSWPNGRMWNVTRGYIYFSIYTYTYSEWIMPCKHIMEWSWKFKEYRCKLILLRSIIIVLTSLTPSHFIFALVSRGSKSNTLQNK